MGRVVLDTSVVIGLLKPDDRHHDRAVRTIADARARGDEFVLPASVFSECLVHPYRRGDAQAVQKVLLGLFGPVRELDAAVALASAQLRLAHPGLRPEDAWVIATGIVDDAAVLTCDRRWAGVDPRVQVLEP